jgi:hypothetical protein
MSRIPGADFRVPTDEELDALAAYQLALGRQEDFELPALTLTSAQASHGKTLFLDSGNLLEPGHKNCNSCHFNGGGTTAMTFIPSDPGFPRVDGSPRGFNIASPTSVNDVPRALALGLPRDGGFGQIPTQFGSFGNTADVPGFPHFELEEFNSPPVVESADTGPFFHNHMVSDLESAVAFYGSPEFKASIAALAVPIDISADPSDPDVQAIAAFLRVLNALENIRSSIDVATRALSMTGAADRRELAGLSRAEVVDALQVLSAGSLAGSTDAAIHSARARLLAAKAALDSAQHLQQLTALENVLSAAIQQLRSARSALADPATLPASFRN